MGDFKINLKNLQDAISLAIKHKINLNKPLDKAKALYDYEEKQKIYAFNNLKSNLTLIKSDILSLPQSAKFDIKNQPIVNQILVAVPELESTDVVQLKKSIKNLINLTNQLNLPKKEIEKSFTIPSSIPSDIRSDIKADIEELNKCFSNNCYRSSIILCGRLLEIALHRKYYELTKNDLLEKSPGIGLGNIMAKLKEQNIRLDPGLTNQIHLINQIRIFSVHKKQEAFYPTKQQTQATILYTLDILEKLFD